MTMTRFQRQRTCSAPIPMSMFLSPAWFSDLTNIQAVGDAIAHARAVCVREHQKLDRVGGVNQFIVSLRHYIKEEVVRKYLGHPEIWYDIGILNPAEVARLGDNYVMVNQMVMQARNVAPMPLALEDVINEGILGLKVSASQAESCNLVTGSINREADRLMDDLNKLAKESE